MTKTPIEPGDILEGDTIRAEYITIMNGPSAHEYVANRSGELWVEDASHFLLDRPKPPVVLPTEPGSYSDSSGDLWIMGESGLLICVAVQQLLALDGALEPYDHEKFGEPAPYLHAPFTKLEPVAETAIQALLLAVKAIEGSNTGTTSFKTVHSNSVCREFLKEFGVTP